MERLSKKSTKLSYFLMVIRYTQVFGFTPFGFDVVKLQVVASKAWCLYAKLFTLSLSLFSIFYLRFYSKLVTIDKKFNILYIVKRVDIYNGCMKMILSYLIQISNRTKLINTINMAIVIGNNLRYLKPSDGFFAKSFWNHTRRVSATLLAQSLLFTYLCYDSWNGLAAMNTHIVYIDFMLTSYYNIGASIFIVKIFYSTGMITGIRLYEIVNERLFEIFLKSVVVSDMEKSKDDLIDTKVEQTMDHLMLISVKIRCFIDSINQLFSTQIMFVIMGCFLSMLSSLYYIYFDILLILSTLNESQESHIVRNITRITFYFLELYNICAISHAAMMELELSSIQLLNNSLHLSIWQMLTVNKMLIIGVASALFAYITLLVQFEMGE